MLTRYYKNVFKKHGIGNWFISWNWSAFFGGRIWLLSKGMDRYALMVSLVLAAEIVLMYGVAAFSLSVVPFFLMDRTLLIPPLLFLLRHIFYGIYGNALYGKFIQTKCGNTEGKVDVDVECEELPEPSKARGIGLYCVHSLLLMFFSVMIAWLMIGRQVMVFGSQWQQFVQKSSDKNGNVVLQGSLNFTIKDTSAEKEEDEKMSQEDKKEPLDAAQQVLTSSGNKE